MLHARSDELVHGRLAVWTVKSAKSYNYDAGVTLCKTGCLTLLAHITYSQSGI